MELKVKSSDKLGKRIYTFDGCRKQLSFGKSFSKRVFSHFLSSSFAMFSSLPLLVVEGV